MRYGIVTILTIIFIIGSLFWGSIDIQFQDNSFTIKAQGWSDYTVDYTKIDSISYEENLFQNSNDYRTNGLGILNMLWEILEMMFMEIISVIRIHPVIHM